MLKVLPIKDKETYEKVMDAALANGHEVIQPTHMVLKDDDVNFKLSNISVLVDASSCNSVFVLSCSLAI